MIDLFSSGRSFSARLLFVLLAVLAGVMGGVVDGSVLSPSSAEAQTNRGQTFWMPEQASVTAHQVDWLFDFVLWICIFFFVLIVALMIYFIARYRQQRPGDAALSQTSHNTPLELTWTIIPLFLVVIIFWLGFKGYMDLATAPGNAYTISVTGQKWSWLFTYPNGVSASELHVPVDTPVKLVMSSQDVLHSFFIPSFRVKQDVVPGRYTSLWFRATKAGTFDVYCTEYCGKGHSDMLTKAIVHPTGEFEKWMDEEGNFIAKLPPVEAGMKVYQKYGCKQCHSVDGVASTGPTFRGIWGHSQALQGGGSVIVDENYVRESILEPNAKVAAGFEAVMPTFQGRIKDDEIRVMIEYLKTLQ